jgi:hypothetical protein
MPPPVKNIGREWLSTAERNVKGMKDLVALEDPVLVVNPEDHPLADQAHLPYARFASAVVDYQWEEMSDPLDFLRKLNGELQTNGILVMAINSWPVGRKAAHLLLLQAGFNRVWFHQTATSGLIVTAQRTTVPSAKKTVSIVLPVYNERRSFNDLIQALLAKNMSYVEREIIIVESNSQDGTREDVLKYKDHPEVRIILEDRPRGKGHAVRAGFQAARGDIVMIQDADLEYDLNDYEALLEPLLQYREVFVLGARHSGSWKMRSFDKQPLLSNLMNCGHLFFRGLINVLYRQCLKDPFTMYKVLWRDCLYGLKFEHNHFDFDHELVIKLIRKGYTPLEIPVNYASRSYSEGKKVNVFLEPWRWLYVDIKNRFGTLKAPVRTKE